MAKIITILIIAVGIALFLICSGLKVNSDEGVQVEKKIGPAASDTIAQPQDLSAK